MEHCCWLSQPSELSCFHFAFLQVSQLNGTTYFLLSFVHRWLLENQRKGNYDVIIKNITDDIACLGVAGPHSRDVLSKLTSSDMSDEKFPYLAFRNIEVAGLPVQASRFSFTGTRYYAQWLIQQNGVLVHLPQVVGNFSSGCIENSVEQCFALLVIHA